MTVNADYFLLWADHNTCEDRPGFNDGGLFRGHLFTTWVRYKFNRFLSGHVMGEYFIPGSYHESPSHDEAYFLRAELLFSF